MDDEYEYEELDDLAPARRFRRGDMLVLVADAVYGVAVALTNTLMIARNLAGMHMNYQCERDAFHQKAALEIETLISGDVDD